MVERIVVLAETPGDSRTMFRLLLDEKLVGEGLTAVQAHVLVGEVLDRLTLPRASASGFSPAAEATTSRG